jgi:hypothetical protein
MHYLLERFTICAKISETTDLPHHIMTLNSTRRLCLACASSIVLFLAGCVMYSTNSSLYEFPHRRATDITPRLWAELTNANGTREDTLVLISFLGTVKLKLATFEFTRQQSDVLPQVEFIKLSRDTVKCILRQNREIIVSYLITCHDDYFTAQQEKPRHSN